MCVLVLGDDAEAFISRSPAAARVLFELVFLLAPGITIEQRFREGGPFGKTLPLLLGRLHYLGRVLLGPLVASHDDAQEGCSNADSAIRSV